MNYDEMKHSYSNDMLQKVINQIRHHVDHKIPFSIVRYGDGEADLLKHTDLTNRIRFRYKNWFGYSPTKEYLLQFRDRFIQSCSNSDINVFQTSNNKDWNSQWFYDKMLNIIDEKSQCVPIKLTNTLFGNIGGKTDSYINKIVKPEDDVIMITCRKEADNIIYKLTGATVRHIIQIPSEMQFRESFGDKDKSSQLPDRLNDIVNYEIPTYVQSGTLVLLGTGPTKAIYCNAIKKQGGIAIDMGSSIDGMCGYCTRGKNKGTKCEV